MVGRPSATAVHVGAAALALLAVVIAAVTCLDAVRFIGRPWWGFGMLPDGSVAPLALSRLWHPEASRQLAFEDRVLGIDGAAVDVRAVDGAAVVERVRAGPLRYTVQRDGSAARHPGGGTRPGSSRRPGGRWMRRQRDGPVQ